MKVEPCKNFYYRILNLNEFNIMLDTLKLDKDDIIRNNRDIDFYEGEVVIVSPKDYIKHYVKPTETLIKIADKYKVTSTEIMEYNQLTNERLYIGQCIKIKKKSI